MERRLSGDIASRPPEGAGRGDDVDPVCCRLDLTGNPVDDLLGAGDQIAATLIAHAGDVRRFKEAAAYARFCGAAPIPCGSARPQAGTVCTAAATAS